MTPNSPAGCLIRQIRVFMASIKELVASSIAIRLERFLVDQLAHGQRGRDPDDHGRHEKFAQHTTHFSTP